MNTLWAAVPAVSYHQCSSSLAWVVGISLSCPIGSLTHDLRIPLCPHQKSTSHVCVIHGPPFVYALQTKCPVSWNQRCVSHTSCTHMCGLSRVCGMVFKTFSRFFLFCFPCWRAGVLSSMPFVVGGKPSVFIGVNKSLDLQLFKSRGYIHPDYVVQKNSYSSKT